MAECVCGRKTDLYLCQNCGDDLHELLTGLATGIDEQGCVREPPAPGFIEHLEDAAWGRTRLGESARRSNERNAPLLCHLGPQGDFKNSPSELLCDMTELLTRWVEIVNTAAETLAVPGEGGS
jgi:hypothetical protein